MNNISPLTKLIRSSIYIVDGKTARYVGPYGATDKHEFHHHGTPVIAAMGSISRADKDQVRAYLTKPATDPDQHECAVLDAGRE